MICFKGYSLIKEFYEKGSTGGVASTLALCILELKLAQGIVCLNRGGADPAWMIAHNKEDLLEAAGSTYEMIKFDFIPGSGLAQIGKPCDLHNYYYSPRISLFCSHSYRKKRDPISKEYACSNKSKIRTVFENPIPCFMCFDHVGFSSDVSVGDSQTDSKMNVMVVHSKLGADILAFAVKHKYLWIEKIPLELIKKTNSYLWRFRK